MYLIVNEKLSLNFVFRKHGFILVKNLFTKLEMDLLWSCFDTQEFKQNMFTRSSGGTTRIINSLVAASELLAALGFVTFGKLVFI